MNVYDFVHLTFLAMDGKVCGRTKLQKTVYFLGELTGELKNLGYWPHYYGPYSSDVAEATNRLVSLGFLEQTQRGIGCYDDRGFEMSRYDMSLTDEGFLVAKKKAVSFSEWKDIQEGAKKIRNAGEEDYMKLSIAAKTHFILCRNRKPVAPEAIAELAPTFGWDVPEDAVQEAAGFLQKVGLATVEEAEE